MNIQKALQWIVSADTGISSKTMWAAIIDVTPYYSDVPKDAADFGRCYRMCQTCEVTRSDLNVVALKFPYWKPVINNWDKLCQMYDRPDSNGFNKLLDSLEDEIMSLKGFKKVGPGMWSKQGEILVELKICHSSNRE